MTTIALWLDSVPIILVGLLLFGTMWAAAWIGHTLRRRRERTADGADGDRDGYIISAVLGLLALLLGFTFALAVDRFETRRSLVLQEANAIGTSYLRSQALTEPHRTRMSAILIAYTDNRIALGTASPNRVQGLLLKNDRLLTDLWSATLAAHDTVRTLPFSTSLLSTVNEVIDLDASRKAARRVRVPAEVFIVLWGYILVSAGILGYARSGSQSQISGAILFLLITTSYMLILDIDRPRSGGIVEAQGPMLDLRESLKNQPPGTFDRWRAPT